jgi:hypothetical protein
MTKQKRQLLRSIDATRSVILANVPKGVARTSAFTALNVVEMNVFLGLNQLARGR